MQAIEGKAPTRTIKLPKFRGGPLELLKAHDHEVICVGPADSSKTWSGCVKAYMLCADKNRKGVHGCMIRKVYNSLHESSLRTFKTIVQGMPIRDFGGQYTDKFIFPNKSELVPIGMDKPDKLLSSEWDFAFISQAEELQESDWEMIASRCTGRGAVVAYPQVFGDCNPSGTRHWIRERARRGTLRLLTATHKDNPALYDDFGQITAEGIKRIGHLEKTLTGVRRKRLLEGIWATAEGAVYDIFNPAVHVCIRSPMEMKRWFLACDEGYTNPFSILLVGEDSDGRRHVFREFYQRGVLPEDSVVVIKSWFTDIRNAKIEFPQAVRCELAAVDEAAAGLIASLKKVDVNAKGGKGLVYDGINLVQNGLKVAGDGRPRLSFDPSCIETTNEMESYVWKKDSDDVPEKEFDHSADALRYLYVVLSTGGPFQHERLARANQPQRRRGAFM